MKEQELRHGKWWDRFATQNWVGKHIAWSIRTSIQRKITGNTGKKAVLVLKTWVQRIVKHVKHE